MPFVASTYDIQAVGTWDSMKLRVLFIEPDIRSAIHVMLSRSKEMCRIAHSSCRIGSCFVALLGVIRFWYQGMGIVYEKQGSAKMNNHARCEWGWFAV